MRTDALIERMEILLGPLEEAGDARRYFHATYLRTTRAVRDALRAGLFSDPEWVERWDVAFADLYLDALTADSSGGAVSRPWAIAFRAAREQHDAPALRHVLLGMNAHINYDLPQALLAVITTGEFTDPAVTSMAAAPTISGSTCCPGGSARKTTSWPGSARCAADGRPARAWPTRRPAAASCESPWARWHNAEALNAARVHGPAAYTERLGDLEALSAARVAELVRPGQVLLRLAVHGFGVRLPGRTGPAAPGKSGSRAPRGPPARAACGPSTRPSWPTLEFRAWVGYYLRDWPGVLRASIGLVRVGFGMDWVRTLHGAWLVLRANQLWAPEDNDPDGARRCMRRFYGLVKISYGQPRDVAEAARLEVDWWRVHRERQHAAQPMGGQPTGGQPTGGQPAGGDPDELAGALTRLYTFLYDEPEAAVRPAAVYRTEAMDLSDQWVAEGCRPDSPLLAREHAALVRSYAALLAAVHH